MPDARAASECFMNSKIPSQPTMASTDEEDRTDDTDDNASSENHRPSLNHRRSMSVDASGIRSQNVFVSGIILASRRDMTCVVIYHFCTLSCSFSPFSLSPLFFSCAMKVKLVPWDSENEWGIKSSMSFVEFAASTSPNLSTLALTLRK